MIHFTLITFNLPIFPVLQSLAAVSDIPRQYRWTKRPQPVGFSAYLATAFTLGELFREETTTKLGWEPAEQGQVLGQAVGRAAGDFCERAEKAGGIYE